ncbi:MAG: class I mannose-6-phosphate isomerase [Clostridia bacterium]|nr:class I mannose-6-phosphate isomerase [Clostridia bacterium]
MTKYPLKLTYTPKTALWGGKRLKTDFGKAADFDVISETWELTVRKDEMARIIGGEADGMTLAEYFETCGYDCVSPDFAKGQRFPLLVKFIDAMDSLSVQVHPDDAYAGRVENDSGKTEMWYIVDAAEGAELIYGLKDGVTSEDFANAAAEGRYNDVMARVPVHAGETYFIPAGMLHAIGAGILIAEIQQNSDLTYRVYDFDRVGVDGKPRELHVEKAVAVTRPYTEREINAIRFARGSKTNDGGELLANSDYFKVSKYVVSDSQRLCATDKSFLSLICTEGAGAIVFGGSEYPIKAGESYFIPAGMGELSVVGTLTVIASEI